MPSASRRRVTHCGRESLSSATPPNHKAISAAVLLHPVQNPLGLLLGLTLIPPLLSPFFFLLSSHSSHSSLSPLLHSALLFIFFWLRYPSSLLHPLYLSRLPPARWWILAVWLVELQSFSHTIFSITCQLDSQIVLRPVKVAWRGEKECRDIRGMLLLAQSCTTDSKTALSAHCMSQNSFLFIWQSCSSFKFSCYSKILNILTCLINNRPNAFVKQYSAGLNKVFWTVKLIVSYQL